MSGFVLPYELEVDDMIILAVDLGDKRTGLAYCDKLQMLSSPIDTVIEQDRNVLAEIIIGKARELQAQKIIIGFPRNMDGTLGTSAAKVEDFKLRLNRLSDIPVELVDERCTTMLAHSYLNKTNTRGKKRKAIIDSVSAVVILEDYLKKNG